MACVQWQPTHGIGISMLRCVLEDNVVLICSQSQTPPLDTPEAWADIAFCSLNKLISDLWSVQRVKW